MSTLSSPGAGAASPGAASPGAASPGPGPVREPRHRLRAAFGVVLFVAWGLLTYIWVASIVYEVAHRSFTAAITAACAVALLLLLGGMEGLEVSVIDRWQKIWPGARESDLAGWISARQLFVALIVAAVTLLANLYVVVVPGTSIQIKNGFYLGLFDLAWVTLTVLWFAQIFWKHLGAMNPDRYVGLLGKGLLPIVEVVRKIGVSQPGEWTADFVEGQLVWSANLEQLTQGASERPLTHGDIWRAIRSTRRGPAGPGGSKPV